MRGSSMPPRRVRRLTGRARETSIVKYQTTAVRIAAKAKADAAFRRQILKDPIKVLTAYGLNRDQTRELINEDAYLRERFGEQARSYAIGWCITTRCCCTSCCLTCWFTRAGRLLRAIGSPERGVRVSPEREKLVARLI